jgi:hypothetical protein
MRFDTLIRSFMIACLISLITVIVEAAYYGLQPENAYSVSSDGYSVTSPFVNNLADLTSPVNLIILAVIFVSAFVIALSKIYKNEKLRKGKTMRRYG